MALAGGVSSSDASVPTFGAAAAEASAPAAFRTSRTAFASGIVNAWNASTVVPHLSACFSRSCVYVCQYSISFFEQVAHSTAQSIHTPQALVAIYQPFGV